MQALIDVIAAAFIFLLFASLYAKRSTSSIGLWMVGWLFIVIHFAALWFNPVSAIWIETQAIVASAGLICCAIAFILSRPECRTSAGRAVTVAALLGLPWIASAVCCSLAAPSFRGAALGAYLGSAAMLFVCIRLIGIKFVRLSCLLLITFACVQWITWSLQAHNVESIVEAVLTESFGCVAVLLSRMHPRRLSAASAIMSCGAILWASVWVVSEWIGHLLPHAVINPEVWNLPKYFLAAGMILNLLEKEIRSAELASEQYRVLFAGNPHPMWMYDPKTFDFLQVNQAAVLHFSCSEQQFLSMNLLQILPEAENPGIRRRLGQTGPQQLSGPWRHTRKDGSILQFDVASQPVRLEGRPVMFALMHDITERQALHGQLLYQAQHDSLTAMPNRDLFEFRFLEAVTRARASACKTAIFCVDLDRFKQINDSYGHAAGDLVLKEVASRISLLMGGGVTAARCGGDEFLIALTDFDEVAQAEAFASHLLGILSSPVNRRLLELDFGASIGFAIYPDDGEEPAQLWRDADAAMYQAKRAGGSQCVRVSYEISSSATEANDIELGLRRALKAGNFEVRYQPQMTLGGQLHSLEALLRSDDPVLDRIPTDRVIRIAEVSGLIVPLGNFVLEEVCRQLRVWIDEGIAPSQIAVNLSPMQLKRPDFARHVASTIDRYQLSPGRIEFEVTESTVMPESGFDAPNQIALLANMGVRFSVDDFGTGYSSLGRLHQLPLDVLKIDRSFTERIAEAAGTFATIQAIIALAHTLGMKVVAEGVENEEQLRLLTDLGCDRLQGFLFGRPMSSSEIHEVLRAGVAPALVQGFA